MTHIWQGEVFPSICDAPWADECLPIWRLNPYFLMTKMAGRSDKDKDKDRDKDRDKDKPNDKSNNEEKDNINAPRADECLPILRLNPCLLMTKMAGWG